jgi:hypothetical protein
LTLTCKLVEEVSRTTFSVVYLSLLTLTLSYETHRHSLRACVMAALSLNLPRGFRFCPTDVELIDHFLRSKITGNDQNLHFISELHFFKREPWDLPGDLFPTHFRSVYNFTLFKFFRRCVNIGFINTILTHLYVNHMVS